MWPLRITVLVLMASSSVLVLGTNSLGCPVCTERNIIKEMTKNAIKEDILRKLGLSSPPSVNVTDLELPYVQQQIDRLRRNSTVDFQTDFIPGSHHQVEEADDKFLARSITILPTIRPPVQSLYSALFFRLPSQVTDSRQELENAELSVHLPAAPTTADSKAVLRVYQVSVDKKSGQTLLTQIKAQKAELRTDAGGRLDVNLTLVTRIWQRRPEENLGIVVKAHLEKDSQMELEIGAVGTIEGPYLTIDIPEADYRLRTKRTTNRVCSGDPDVTQCCLWPLTIDFEEFSWDWVLFPETYEANICGGDCTLGVPTGLNHGSLTQHGSGLFSPCCSAKKKSDVDILYLDQERNVVKAKLPNMKVEQCGCS